MADLIIKSVPAGMAVEVLNPDGSVMARVTAPNTFGGCAGYQTRIVPLTAEEQEPGVRALTFALGRLLGKTEQEIKAEAAASLSATPHPL